MKMFMIVCLVLVCVVADAPAAPKPSKDGLIREWEITLKDAPDTKVFEKTENGRYKFKTDAFPYDGELKLLNVAISKYGDGFFNGTVEIDLPDLTEGLKSKLAESYRQWDWKHNRLYFNNDDSTWLSSGEYSKRAQARTKQGFQGRIGEIIPYLLAAFFMGVLVLAVWATREGSKQTKEIAKLRESISKTNENLARIVERFGFQQDSGDNRK